MTTEQRPQHAETEGVERWLAWFKANERRLMVVGAILVVLAGGVWFTLSARSRRETFARRELEAARVAAEAGNLPLAANDLSRIVASYGGTSAGQEAVLLLAQVRLLQGQTDQAVTDLQTFLAEGPRPQYRAPAYGALGAALEQAGQFGPAARAYEDGAQASEYTLLSVRLLIEAGRAYMLAQDTTGAVRVFQAILTDHGETAAATEAQLRLAELGRYEEAPPGH